MAEEIVRAELAEPKVELQRLKDNMPVGKMILHKDNSLITLIPKWDGSEEAGIRE
jgi:hypothetical protein